VSDDIATVRAIIAQYRQEVGASKRMALDHQEIYLAALDRLAARLAAAEAVAEAAERYVDGFDPDGRRHLIEIVWKQRAAKEAGS